MEVYDDNARKVGAVSQVGIAQDQSLVLVIEADDGTTSVLSWNRVKAIGHIVLVGEEETAEAAKTETVEEESVPVETAEAEKTAVEEESVPVEPGQCPDCSHTNTPDSKFCEECGNDIGK